MNGVEWREITRQGLWKNNPALVQLLGLCPLLAVTGTVVNALGLGAATMLVLSGSNLCVSLIRNLVTPTIRLPAFVMIIAAFTTCVELLMEALSFELFQILGIFIPLIVTNCVILGRAEGFASRNTPPAALLDGFMMGLGFTVVLVILGGARELLGQGTLFDGMHLLFGEGARGWRLHLLPEDYPGFLLAVLPPGAFIGMGLLIALKNETDRRLLARRRALEGRPVKGSKRVRTTGEIA